MNLGVVLSAVVVALAASVSGQGYELDPQKLDQRYNLIQGIVSQGIYNKAHSAYKPQIGYANNRYPSKGYNTGSPSYNTGAKGYNNAAVNNFAAKSYNPGYQGYQGYNAGNLGYNNPAVNNYGAGNSGYTAPSASYAPYNQARGYNAAGYPNVGVAYPRSNLEYRPPTYGAIAGYKFGGGRVHPIFNNDLLYRPKVNTDLGSFANKDPVFIGGQSTPTIGSAQSPSPSKGVVTVPQINAYGSSNLGAVKGGYTGVDTIGATYTGQQGTLFQNLPGYTNPYFRKA